MRHEFVSTTVIPFPTLFTCRKPLPRYISDENHLQGLTKCRGHRLHKALAAGAVEHIHLSSCSCDPALRQDTTNDPRLTNCAPSYISTCKNRHSSLHFPLSSLNTSPLHQPPPQPLFRQTLLHSRFCFVPFSFFRQKPGDFVKTLQMFQRSIMEQSRQTSSSLP